MDTYDVVTASRLLIEFTNEFSTWYLRLSRERLKSGEQEESGHVFARVLVLLCKLYAPFIPFITETLFQNISDSGVSIHLTDWPKSEDMAAFEDAALELQMQLAQTVTEQALALRKKDNLKVRQPLSTLSVTSLEEKPSDLLLNVVKQEVNIKTIEWSVVSKEEMEKLGHENFIRVALDTTLTPELIAEGKMRESVRDIQDMRKTLGIDVDTWVEAWLPSWPESFEEEIKRRTMCKKLHVGEPKIEVV